MRKYRDYFRGWSDHLLPDGAYLDGKSDMAVSDEAHRWRGLCRVRPALLTSLRSDVLPAYLALGVDAPRSLAALQDEIETGEGAVEDLAMARAMLANIPDGAPAPADPRRPSRSVAMTLAAYEADDRDAAQIIAFKDALYRWAMTHGLDTMPEIIEAALATLAGMAATVRALLRWFFLWRHADQHGRAAIAAAMVPVAVGVHRPYVRGTSAWVTSSADVPTTLAPMPMPRESRPVTWNRKAWWTFDPGAWLARLILTPDAAYPERRETFTSIAAEAGVSYPFVMRKVKALADRYRVRHLLERHARTSRRSP